MDPGVRCAIHFVKQTLHPHLSLPNTHPIAPPTASPGHESRTIRPPPTPQHIRRLVADRLAGAGFDLVQAFGVTAYNDVIADQPRLRPVDTFGRDDALALLIGNTQALWEPFASAWQGQPLLQQDPDPLDQYTVEWIQRALNPLPVAWTVRFAFDTGPELVSMLHVAEVSGLAHRGPAQLAIHPIHGPWFALRALVVLDADPVVPAPGSAPDPCAACEAPCVGALHRAIQAAANPTQNDDLSPFLAVRDACPIGTDSRYPQAQIRYHYAHALDALRDGLLP